MAAKLDSAGTNVTDRGTVGKISRDPAQQQAAIEIWKQRLQSYRSQLAQDPQSNPIKQLALDISRKLEIGKISQQQLAGLVKALCDNALVRRA